MFLFDPAFLHIVTPLNFAFYSKYTLEEMILYPILALLQGSAQLRPFDDVVHSFDRSVVQFKEFALYQPEEPSKDLPCFVSLPEDPRRASVSALKEYLRSLGAVKSKSSASVIVYAPYRAGQESLW